MINLQSDLHMAYPRIHSAISLVVSGSTSFSETFVRVQKLFLT
jgi:hypothetical protein